MSMFGTERPVDEGGERNHRAATPTLYTGGTTSGEHKRGP